MALITDMLEHGTHPPTVVRRHRLVCQVRGVGDAREQNGRVIQVPAAVTLIDEIGGPLGDECPQFVGNTKNDRTDGVEVERVDVSPTNGLFARSAPRGKETVVSHADDY